MAVSFYGSTGGGGSGTGSGDGITVSGTIELLENTKIVGTNGLGYGTVSYKTIKENIGNTGGSTTLPAIEETTLKEDSKIVVSDSEDLEKVSYKSIKNDILNSIPSVEMPDISELETQLEKVKTDLANLTYEDLDNKPSINGITLSGDMTSDDLNIILNRFQSFGGSLKSDILLEDTILTIENDYVLNKSIENYDFLIFTYYANQPGYINKDTFFSFFDVKDIVYNNSSEQVIDKSRLYLSNCYGVAMSSLMFWFKNEKTIRSYQFNKENISNTEPTVKITGYKFKPLMPTDDTTIGTIISYMGVTPPNHYIPCDGSIYNISDYIQLTKHFEKDFGSVNYFGGDGITTFAVPDLRGEFLRGTGENGHENCGNGENVGVHQNGTEHLNFFVGQKDELWVQKSNGIVSNRDTEVDKIIQRVQWLNDGSFNATAPYYSKYTSRPTNTSVLYCIKYESQLIEIDEYTDKEVEDTITSLFYPEKEE